MTEHRPGTRGQEHVIEIDASPEDVWRAISQAEEVIRWYVSKAEIDGRVGGTYSVSWGEGMDGMSDIVAWEPGQRFRIEHRKPEGAPDIPTGAIAEEYFLEDSDGRTVLRLVTSGIPDTEDWDWFYDGTERGWRIFLLGLKHYLENHDGLQRDQIVTMVGLPGSCEDAWPVLVGDQGLGLAQSLDGAATGDAYAGTTGFGEDLSGEVLLVNAPYRLLTTVEGMNNALLGATLEQMGANNFLYLSLSTFGLSAEDVDATRTRWIDWVNGLFPSSTPPEEAFQEMYDGVIDAAAEAGQNGDA